MGVTEDLPDFIDPMLAVDGELPATSEGVWTTEVKWDGMRAQVRVTTAGAVTLRSRSGRAWTDCFPEVAGIAEQLAGRAALLDGELVCCDEAGLPDFGRLRTRLAGERRAAAASESLPATFIAFDILHFDGRSTRPMAFERRRELLLSLGLDGPAWTTPSPLLAAPLDVSEATRERGLEGVVVKRLDSAYRRGRSRAWVKHKHRATLTFVVSGWTRGDGEPDTLLLARRSDGGVQPAGSVQFGLTTEDRAALRDALESLERVAAGSRRGPATMVEPVIEVDVTTGAAAADGRPVRDPILRAWRRVGTPGDDA